MAVAAVRGNLTASDLICAFYDVSDALGLTSGEYCEQLSASPEEIAKRLTELAEQRSND